MPFSLVETCVTFGKCQKSGVEEWKLKYSQVCNCLCVECGSLISVRKRLDV